MKMKKTTRREFLKNTALFSAGMVLGFSSPEATLKDFAQKINSKPLLGRVFSNGANSYSNPDLASEIVNTFQENDVLPLPESILINSSGPVKSLWYRLADGSFLRSAEIQPVTNQLNAPNLEVGSSGQLAEVSVPFTDAWSSSANGRKPNQIFYYGTTHWVIGLGQDKEKNYYYLVKEDRWGDLYYVDATHMRLISEEELQPISPSISEKSKTIQIYLDEQFMVAFENEEPVFMSPLASGFLSGNMDFTTPRGTFIINYKRPSRHMAHAERFGANGGELFGVPWVSYFTDTGIAFHGTYWHNEYIQPKSHGCINLPISAAKWVYLWSYPVITPRQEKHVSQYGTQVEIL